MCLARGAIAVDRHSTQLAVHYQRRGFRTCLVCADTFRAGAFDQLKQNATKAKIPFFGSYSESDPVAISASGVAKFKAEKFEIIIVDTSGRHRQESELFKEMVEISEAVTPNLTIMVLDGAIGQAAESQSRAFKEAAGFGAIIVTKMDGHAKGGGAISAVAATKTPIMFIGTGEHLHDLEKFSPGPFISKMLGMGDISGLMEHVAEVQNAGPDSKEKREEMIKKLEQGIFTIRDMRDQLTNVMSMGPLSKLASMIPGMSDLLNSGGKGGEEDASKRMKRLLYIMDAMTTEELDSDGTPFHNKQSEANKKSDKANGKARDKTPGSTPLETMTNLPEGQPRRANRRVLRVARGSGTSVREVEELLAQHRMFGAMVKQAGGKQVSDKCRHDKEALLIVGYAGLHGESCSSTTERRRWTRRIQPLADSGCSAEAAKHGHGQRRPSVDDAVDGRRGRRPNAFDGINPAHGQPVWRARRTRQYVWRRAVKCSATLPVVISMLLCLYANISASFILSSSPQT